MLRDVPANNVRALLDFMHERQRVYLKRKSRKPFPWTDDPVEGISRGSGCVAVLIGAPSKQKDPRASDPCESGHIGR
jgi:hypothetical protein